MEASKLCLPTEISRCSSGGSRGLTSIAPRSVLCSHVRVSELPYNHRTELGHLRLIHHHQGLPFSLKTNGGISQCPYDRCGIRNSITRYPADHITFRQIHRCIKDIYIILGGFGSLGKRQDSAVSLWPTGNNTFRYSISGRLYSFPAIPSVHRWLIHPHRRSESGWICFCHTAWTLRDNFSLIPTAVLWHDGPILFYSFYWLKTSLRHPPAASWRASLTSIL